MSLYFIAVIPHQQLTEKVREIHKDFAERFNSVKSYKNFPHITLIKPFSFDENKEDELVDKFSEMVLKTIPFHVVLNDFGCFPNKSNPVIFIKPKNTAEIQNLYDEVRPQMNFHPISQFHPHLTVAYRDLTYENFLKAWGEYKIKTFEDSFLVDKICLFKHYNGKWNLLKIKNLESFI